MSWTLRIQRRRVTSSSDAGIPLPHCPASLLPRPVLLLQLCISVQAACGHRGWIGVATLVRARTGG